MPLTLRYHYLQEAFADEEDIEVAMLDETDLPPMPQGWDAWFKRLFDLLKITRARKLLFMWESRNM